MQKLLETGKTDLLKDFVSSRTKRKFSAYLVRGKDGKVGFEFEPRPAKAGAKTTDKVEEKKAENLDPAKPAPQGATLHTTRGDIQVALWPELAPATVQNFAALARSCHAYGERVEDPAEMVPAITRALAAIQQGQAAVLDVIIARI